MGYIKTLPLPPPRCRSVPHQLPPASAVCSSFVQKLDEFLNCYKNEAIPAVFLSNEVSVRTFLQHFYLIMTSKMCDVGKQ